MGNKSVKNRMIKHEVSGKSYEDKIHNIITRNKFAVMREYLYKNPDFIQQHKERRTDMKISYDKMILNLESDGPVHGDLETPTKSTMKRNADLIKLGLPLIIINQESIKFLIKAMREEGKLNGASEDDIMEFMITYLLWMEYSKHISEKEYG